MRKLQKDTGMAILFITHDLGVTAQMADHVAVMRTGKIVEAKDKTKFVRQPGTSLTHYNCSMPFPGWDKRQAESDTEY